MELNQTQKRLLDAAEVLFAEKGFEMVSLREITAKADANVAAVNYHFGSKENMIEAVMARLVLPIHTDRMARLDALLLREQQPTIREAVDAFLRPMMDRILVEETRQQLFAKFLARAIGEGTCRLPEQVIPLMREMTAKVVEAFQMASPNLTEQQAFWGVKFCFAVMKDAIMRDDDFEKISEGRFGGESDWDQVFEEVLDFCEGGLNR